MTPAQRAAGVEKMARALCEKLGADPENWKGTQRLAGNPGVAATAALAAWEAHWKLSEETEEAMRELDKQTVISL